MKLSIAILTLTLGGIVLAQQSQPPPAPAPTKPRLTLTTTGFEDGGIIPNKFTMAAEGTPVSPKLMWTYVPDGTVSFALILHDPDTAPMKKTDEVLHWMIFNIPGTATELPEGVPAQAQLSDGSVQALNQSKKVGYMGMGAAAVGPYHHYTFELFAIDSKIDVPQGTPQEAANTRTAVMNAIDGHVLGKALLVARFHR